MGTPPVGATRIPCPDCEGQKEILAYFSVSLGNVTKPCPRCEGLGWLFPADLTPGERKVLLRPVEKGKVRG